MLNIQNSNHGLNKIKNNYSLPNNAINIPAKERKNSSEFLHSFSFDKNINNRVAFAGLSAIPKFFSDKNRERNDLSFAYRNAVKNGNLDKCDKILTKMKDADSETLKEFIFFRNDKGHLDSLINYSIEQGPSGAAINLIRFIKNLKNNEDLKKSVALFSKGQPLTSFIGTFHEQFTHFAKASYYGESQTASEFLNFVKTLPDETVKEFVLIGGTTSQFYWAIEVHNYDAAYEFLKFVETIPEDARKAYVLHKTSERANEFKIFSERFVDGKWVDRTSDAIRLATKFMKIVQTLPQKDQEQFAKETSYFWKKCYFKQKNAHFGKMYLDFVRSLSKETQIEIATELCDYLKRYPQESHTEGENWGLMIHFFPYAVDIVPDKVAELNLPEKAGYYGNLLEKLVRNVSNKDLREKLEKDFEEYQKKKAAEEERRKAEEEQRRRAEEEKRKAEQEQRKRAEEENRSKRLYNQSKESSELFKKLGIEFPPGSTQKSAQKLYHEYAKKYYPDQFDMQSQSGDWKQYSDILQQINDYYHNLPEE